MVGAGYCPSDKPITSCDIDFWGFADDLAALERFNNTYSRTM